tara:strand:- start:100 stop:780 length:681 start_codon:yes stop_codon:yes gene_type:complete
MKYNLKTKEECRAPEVIPKGSKQKKGSKQTSNRTPSKKRKHEEPKEHPLKQQKKTISNVNNNQVYSYDYHLNESMKGNTAKTTLPFDTNQVYSYDYYPPKIKCQNPECPHSLWSNGQESRANRIDKNLDNPKFKHHYCHEGKYCYEGMYYPSSFVRHFKITRQSKKTIFGTFVKQRNGEWHPTGDEIKKRLESGGYPGAPFYITPGGKHTDGTRTGEIFSRLKEKK